MSSSRPPLLPTRPPSQLLDLSFNHVRKAGAARLCDGLGRNATLTDLRLQAPPKHPPSIPHRIPPQSPSAPRHLPRALPARKPLSPPPSLRNSVPPSLACLTCLSTSLSFPPSPRRRLSSGVPSPPLAHAPATFPICSRPRSGPRSGSRSGPSFWARSRAATFPICPSEPSDRGVSIRASRATWACLSERAERQGRVYPSEPSDSHQRPTFKYGLGSGPKPVAVVSRLSGVRGGGGRQASRPLTGPARCS